MKRVKAYIPVLAVILSASTFVFPMNSQGGVTFNAGMQDEPKTLNPFQAQDVWDWHVLGYFYEGLVTYRPIDFKIVPNVALEVPVVSSAILEYTVKMRDDVYWSDGAPVTAHDYALFGNMVLEFQIGRYLSSWEFVEEVTALDDYTLYFKLTECRVTFIEGTLMSLPIPSHIWEPKLDEFRAAENPTKALQEYQPVEPDEILSCGPLIFEAWVRGSYIKSKKNPNYFDEGHVHTYDDGTQLILGPNIDYLVYRIYDTTDAAILGLKKGEIDYIWWAIQPGYVSDLLADPNITVTNNPENGIRYIAFNCQREPFSDLAFRQAVAVMTDREFIQSRVLQNYGEALYTVVPPGNKVWYNPDVIMWGKGLSKNERVVEAVNILKASGNYSWDTEPGIDANGNLIEGEGMMYKGEYIAPFVILTPPADYDPLRAMCGMLIQEWLKLLGLPVTARPTAFGTIVQKAMGERDYDMYILGWSLSLYPDYLRDFFHSSQIMEYGYNMPQYSNPEFDRISDSLVTCGSRSEKIEAAFMLQEYIAEECPYVPLFAPAAIEAYRNDRFEGWFDQLDGIEDCIMYVTPVVIPGETQEEIEDEARYWEDIAEKYEDDDEWENAANSWENAAENWKLIEKWENAAENWEKSAKSWRKVAEYYGNPDHALAAWAWEMAARAWRKASEAWIKLGEWRNAGKTRQEASRDSEKGAEEYGKAGDDKKAEELRKIAEEDQKIAEGYCEKGGICLGTLFVALVVVGGIFAYFKRRN